MRSGYLLWIIIILTLLAIFVDLPNVPAIRFLDKDIQISFPLKLGLDLQGGTQLILEAETGSIAEADRDSALDSVKEVIERRVNSFGISESRVQTSTIGNQRRILVELPGLKDSTAAAELVGKTAKLDFRELSARSDSSETRRATASAEATESALLAILESVPTGLTGADLIKAAPVFGGSIGTSGPQISIRFNDTGAKKFAEVTKRNIGKPLAIFLDDELLEAPTVQQEIIGGDAVITGQFTIEQAKRIATQLNAGALKVPVRIINQRSIGPELGQESINKSLIAGIIGLGVVILYMAVFYGVLGLIADLALVIYTVLVLAIFKTGLFVLPPVTLTLAGIAGFILSIGMAVDANILIFERMKEELRWGKSKGVALELGFKRAWSSIWASNVSSLITAVILYSMGSSLVRGFAITLAIGVLVSMFTAIIVTRTLLRLIIK